MAESACCSSIGPYPGDVAAEKWARATFFRATVSKDVPQRKQSLSDRFNPVWGTVRSARSPSTNTGRSSQACRLCLCLASGCDSNPSAPPLTAGPPRAARRSRYHARGNDGATRSNVVAAMRLVDDSCRAVSLQTPRLAKVSRPRGPQDYRDAVRATRRRPGFSPITEVAQTAKAVGAGTVIVTLKFANSD
jgi:hypothetical protein